MKRLIQMLINGVEKMVKGYDEPGKNTVSIKNFGTNGSSIIVNGAVVGSGYQGIVEIVWNGPAANIDATNVKVIGNVDGDVDGTNVTISGDVIGNVDGVNVTCENVTGDVDATIVSKRR